MATKNWARHELLRLKRIMSHEFDSSKRKHLESLSLFALYSYILRLSTEFELAALRISECDFDGNQDKWASIELGLALLARNAREQGKEEQARDALSRIRGVGFVRERLSGTMLRGATANIRSAEAILQRSGLNQVQRRSVTKSLIGSKEAILMELYFIGELGGTSNGEHEFEPMIREIEEFLTSVDCP
ncbi:MAG: hypothetical protein KDI51_06885 [Xanthomonadales bacterium]|nr:hypothetical protein [Xanthomonadales bacterium]